MKHFKLLLILLSALLIFSSYALVSCDGDEEVTIESIDVGTTEAPEVTTASPETTETIETTEEATTESFETTETIETTEVVVTEPPHTHSFGAWNTIKIASCTEEGMAERVCSCGQKETESVAKTEHKAGEWIIDKDSTETEEGSKHQVCTTCGVTVKTETIALKPHVHVFGVWNTVKIASCTEEGLTERICSCGQKEIESIAKTEHRAGEWIIDKEATATAEGSKHQVCAVCGETLKTESIPVTPHIPGEWIIDKQPTCTESGSRHRVCTKCGETTDTEVLPAKGHTEVVIPAKDATCTETGLTSGTRCTVCSTVITAQQTVPAKGHTEKTVPAKAPTCTASGLTEGKTCIVCYATLTAQQTVPATGHKEQILSGQNATCTETGLTEGKLCEVCGEILVAQQIIPMIAHSEQIIPAKAATCTATGLTEGKKCSVCNAVLLAQETVPTVAHTEGEWIVDKEPTLSATGSKHQVCAVCGTTIKTETIPVLEPNKIDYTVTLLDGSHNPVAGVKVVFANGAVTVGEAITNDKGVAVVTLVEGNYEASFDTDSSYYAPSSVTLTVSNPTAEVILVKYAENPEYVYPDEVNGVYTIIGVGSVRVPVAKDEMRYFFFIPSEGAKYKFYTDSNKVEVGYYGGNFFVSETNIGDIDEAGAMIIEVLHSSKGSTYVIGLKSTSSAVTECTLTIEKDSDIGISDAERPWDQYQLSKTPEKIADVKGSQHYVQITADISNIFKPTGAISEIEVFYNEQDGYYHLNSENGPKLYVMINNPTVFQEALITIANVTNIGRYFYDEQGNFIKKESYNDAIIAYGAAADKNGVVPLDDDLVYILKNIGENGWYDMLSKNSIFADDEAFVYEYNAWLFAVCYFS